MESSRQARSLVFSLTLKLTSEALRQTLDLTATLNLLVQNTERFDIDRLPFSIGRDEIVVSAVKVILWSVLL